MLADAKRFEPAARVLLDYVREPGEDPTDYESVLSRLLEWRNPRKALVFSQRYVERLYRGGDRPRAFKVFLRAFDMDDRVRPLGEEPTLRLAALAWEAGGPDTAFKLVDDFEGRFPQEYDDSAGGRRFSRVSSASTRM